MAIRDWLRSWTLLLGGATLFAIGSVGFAVMGFWGVDEIPAGAAIAFIGITLIGIGTFIVSLPIAWLFRRGGLAKTIAACFIVAAATFIYYTSGWFIGMLPLWVLGTGVGLLALFEEHAGV